MRRSRPEQTAAGNFYARVSGRRWNPAAITAALIACILLPWLNGSPGYAQSTISLEGHVYDVESEHPVPGAVVRVVGTDYQVRTDAFGHFFFEHMAIGEYRLEVSTGGYRTQITDIIHISGDVTARTDVGLERIIYELEEREVRGRRMSGASAAIAVVDRAEIRRSNAADLGEVLDRIEGVYIRRSGPGGGETRISIRGCDPAHVLVLVDGQRINLPGSGEADIGTIPIEMIERVEVYRGGESARFGPDALGGVVNITTMHTPGYRPEILTETYFGKWNTGSYRVLLHDPIRLPGMSGKVSYSLQESDGDFPYRYSVEPSSRTYTGIRQNADSRTQNIFGSVIYRLDDRTSLHASGQAYRSRQGLPGSVSNIDTTAWKRDSRLLGSVRLKHAPSSDVDLELELGRLRFEQYFNNVDHQYRDYRYEDRYVNDLTSTELTGRYRYWTGSEAAGGIEFRRDVIHHENLYRPDHSTAGATRNYLGIFVIDRHEINLDEMPFLNALVFDYSLRRDNVVTNSEDPEDSRRRESGYWSYKTGVSITHGRGYKVVARASYGKSLRLPALHALFWSGDVRSASNPDLRPERSEHSEAGVELSIDGALSVTAGMTYFHSYISDLIVWQPGYQQVWKPVNLDAAVITGHEDVIRASLHEDLLTFSYRNTVTVAKNRGHDANTDGRILTFRPHYITDLEWTTRYRFLQASYQIRFVDVRYSTAANTRWYGAYRIDDASVAAEIALSQITLTVGYRVHNLRDEHYELIGQYPMPGREWGVDISLDYQL